MTLIDSKIFDTIAFGLGTLFFVGFILWSLWFASRMK